MINGWLLAAFGILAITVLVASHYLAYLFGQLSILRRTDMNSLPSKEKP